MTPRDPHSSIPISALIPQESFNATIEVTVKNVYGKYLYYPANEQAQHLSRITKTETLTREVLDIAKQMGFTINTIHFIPPEVKFNA